MSAGTVLLLLSTIGAAGPTSPVWVSFAPRGLDAATLQARLEARRAELSERALRRRSRMSIDGGVHERDLAPNPEWVAAVLATGARPRVTSRWLNAISVEVDDVQRAAIAALPYVVDVRPVSRRARLVVDEPPPSRLLQADLGMAATQLDAIGIGSLHECGLTGSGMVIGILDTGFVLEHDALTGVDVLDAYDFVGDDTVVSEETGDPAGQNNHGTMVLSLIAGREPGTYSGVAPDASVLLAKVDYLPTDEPIEDDWWVAGIEWLEAAGADVVTNSLGFCSTCAADVFDGATHATTTAATIAVTNGVVVVTSAGNRGPAASTINAPADADGIIAVGNIRLDGQIAYDSSRGPTYDGRTKPDVVAPGYDVWTVDPATLTEYHQVRGTSFAAPIAAALAALVLQAEPTLTPAQVYARLTSTASRATTPDNSYGYGMVDGEAALSAHCTCADADADGRRDAGCGGTDCDDTDATIPGMESCSDGIDNDCDGATDAADTDCDVEEPPRKEDGAIGSGGCAAGGPTALLILCVVALLFRRRARL